MAELNKKSMVKIVAAFVRGNSSAPDKQTEKENVRVIRKNPDVFLISKVIQKQPFSMPDSKHGKRLFYFSEYCIPTPDNPAQPSKEKEA